MMAKKIDSSIAVLPVEDGRPSVLERRPHGIADADDGAGRIAGGDAAAVAVHVVRLRIEYVERQEAVHRLFQDKKNGAVTTGPVFLSVIYFV